jgi:hypothetical protein
VSPNPAGVVAQCIGFRQRFQGLIAQGHKAGRGNVKRVMKLIILEGVFYPLEKRYI